ncbi:MAG: P-loop NTPase [Deltaproteobacteria bacterium]|nr:P-loop NTPase [Deltaproteobacteria bacterium]
MAKTGASPQIVAVGGGKGGVGKTLLAANLALALADRGQRVLLVDADLGSANAHTVLGLPAPLATLSDFLERKADLGALAVSTPYANLRFVSGALDDVGAANPQHQSKMRLLRKLSGFDADFLVLDLGAGTGFNTLDFFLIASCGILVVLPEPTSVENAYRFLKAAFFRRLAVVEKAFGIKDLVDEARAQKNRLNIKTPADLLRAVAERDPEVGAQVQQQMNRFHPRLVLNQASDEAGADDLQIARDMASACRRFLGINLEVFGALPEDDAVRRAVRMRQPLRVSAPDSMVKRAIDEVAERVLRLEAVEEVAA